MLAKLRRVRLIGVGFYDFDGQKYYYADLHDPSGREPVLRASISKEIDRGQVDQLVREIEEGDRVVRLDLDCELSSQTKVIKGTDRTAVTHKITIEHFEPAKEIAPVAEFDEQRHEQVA